MLLKDELANALKTNVSKFIAIDEVKKTQSTGVHLLDTILAGGFVIGDMTMLVGKPGSGKSTLAAQAGRALLDKYEDAMAIYLDTEQSFSVERLQQLGVDTSRAMIVSHDVSLEKVFNILDEIFKFKETHDLLDVPFLVVWDSVAATGSEKIDEVDKLEQMIGYEARLLTYNLKKYVKNLAKYNIIFVVINQLRDKISMGPYNTPSELRWLGNKDVYGGNALKYLAFTLIYMSPTSPEFYSESGQSSGIVAGFEGSTIKVYTVKNKLMKPNVRINLVLNYNEGFDNIWTSLMFLKELKIAVPGSWWKIKGIEKKFRAKEFSNLYYSDESFRLQFDNIASEHLLNFEKQLKENRFIEDVNQTENIVEDLENTAEE